MATIRTAIQVDDRMSGAFRAMNNALNIVVNSFADLQDATHNAVDVSSIQAARTELARAESAFNQIESSIQGATQQQEQFNRTVTNGGNAMGGLMGKVKSLVGAYVGMKAIEGGMDATDSYVSRQARLGLIVEVDDEAVDAAQQKIEATAGLQNEIFAAAQRSRGEYGAMVDTVAKLGLLAGEAFNDTSEIVAFSETMQKAFKISGASTSEATNAMYQLNQAMASGRLQGDEYRSIIENAPLLADAIAEYCGVSRGELKELSSDGEISAEVIKGAVFKMASDVEEQFAEMPMTFSDAWTSIKNTATNRAQEVMQAVNANLNSNTGQAIIQGINNSIGVLINTLGIVLTIVMSVAGFFVDNWSMIEPIIWGVVGALGFYTGALMIHNGIQAFSNGLEALSAIAKYRSAKSTLANAAAHSAEAVEIAKATVAQAGFNTALFACPITWIIIAIIALIAIFYAAVAAVNKFAGTSYSATGIVCGAFMWLLSVIGNIFIALGELILGVVEYLVNPFINFANFLGNLFTNPISSIIYAFRDMGDSVLRILENIASAIDTVFGSNLSGAISGWRSGLSAMADSAVKKYAPDENYEKIIENIDLSMSDFGINRFDNTDAYNTGYDFGEGIDKKIDSMFNFEMPDYEPTDYSSMLSDIGSGVGDTADNTGKTADNTDTSTEDLKYLRDIAERETVNRFTTAEIKVDMGGVNNTVTKMNDLDGIADYLAVKVEEQMQIAAEGVHE